MPDVPVSFLCPCGNNAALIWYALQQGTLDPDESHGNSHTACYTDGRGIRPGGLT